MKVPVFLTLLAVLMPCRFTVRDVGFVDLGDPGYRLQVFVSAEESAAAKATLQRLCKAQLADVNVEVSFVDPDAEEQLPAHRLLREQQIQEFPALVLVHPDGQALRLPLPGEFADAASPAVESVASSPLRRRIREACLRRYCAVLLVEGGDAGENRRAAEAVRQAFEVIKRGFDVMPKAVGDLPILLVLPAEARQQERVLLWSLGIDAAPVQPSVAVLFGRGRRFGPILDGADIDRDTALGILSKAGESCECDLDRSWMRGPRLPLRWDDEVKQLATELLGFDPENPVIKSEISGILSKRPRGRRGATDSTPTVAELLAGYSEVAIEAPAVPLPSADPVPDADLEAEEADAAWWWPILATALGLLALSLLSAGLLFLRSRRS